MCFILADMLGNVLCICTGPRPGIVANILIYAPLLCAAFRLCLRAFYLNFNLASSSLIQDICTLKPGLDFGRVQARLVTKRKLYHEQNHGTNEYQRGLFQVNNSSRP